MIVQILDVQAAISLPEQIPTLSSMVSTRCMACKLRAVAHRQSVSPMTTPRLVVDPNQIGDLQDPATVSG